MDKKEALKRLAALETEAAKLREALVEAPEPVEKKPLLNYDITCDNATFFGVEEAAKKEAQAYADAINTLLDLRRQPGSEAAKRMTKQWLIDAGGTVQYVCNTEWKLQQLCPMFDSAESALAAKEAVGWDRIKRMMDTLHGRTE